MFGSSLGILRSLIIYYVTPLRIRNLKRFYKTFLKEDELCFDIGAHVGNRSVCMSAAGCKVIALEPHPHLFKWLKLLSHLCPFTPVELAIENTIGPKKLFLSSTNLMISSLNENWTSKLNEIEHKSNVNRWSHSVDVQTTTLDALIQQFGIPHYCKVDVEGNEPKVFETLSTPIPLISFEHLPSTLEQTTRVLQQLSALGPYEYNYVIGERHSFHKTCWVGQPAILKELQNYSQNRICIDVFARLTSGQES